MPSVIDSHHQQIDLTKYPENLSLIGLTLLEPYKGSKAHHQIQCKNCTHVWSATPLSKIQAFKKFGTNGCPQCCKNRIQQTKDETKKTIEQHGFTVLGEYTNSKTKLLVRNNSCGHEWETTPEHIIGAKVNCKICNNQTKRERFQSFNQKRSEEFFKTASEWVKYRHRVFHATRITYRDHKEKINPNNLPRGTAGLDGAYHLDHIIPIRYCFENNIPVDVCARVDNLQMLPWLDNVSSRDRLKSLST